MTGAGGTGAVGEEDVRRIAQLARLRLADEEVRTFTLQLNDILAHVEELRAAGAEAGDREGAASHPDRAEGAPAPAADIPGPDPLLHPPAELAPAFEDGFFTLPRLAALDPGEAAAPGGGG